MTRREQCNFILHVILPAIESEGLTVKTRCDGELTLPPEHPSVSCFVNDMRQHINKALNAIAPSSPYGV